MPTQTKTKEVTFRSWSPNQQVVIRPGRPEARDINNRVVSPRVESIHADFEDHEFITDDPDIIKALQENEQFQTPRGWWEDGKAPDEPKPTTREQHKAIAEAAAKGDTEKLHGVIATEEETHNRVGVLESARVALANIEVPKAEEHGVIARADEPAEKADAVPRVDPAEPPKLEPEIEREKVIKSEVVAEERGEAAALAEDEPEQPVAETPVEEQIEAERGAESAEDTEQAAKKGSKKKSAKKGSKKKSAKKGSKKSQANTGQRTTDSASEGAS